jgi:hypothetical protein
VQHFDCPDSVHRLVEKEASYRVTLESSRSSRVSSFGICNSTSLS